MSHHTIDSASHTITAAAAERIDAFIMGRLIPLRGPSGKLYGELDTQTGVIIFRRGKLPAERIDLTPYFTAAIVKADDHR